MELKQHSQFDIVSYGNSIMDLLGHVEEATITDLKLDKGTAKMVEDSTAKIIMDKLHSVSWKKSPGGSALNTIRFSSQLGSKNYFAGAVGKDENGSLLVKQLKQMKIHQDIVSINDSPTGTLLSMITPDAERTMVFDLGASKLFSMQHVKDFNIVQHSKMLHWTAYKLMQPRMMEVISHAMHVAKQHKTMVSFDFADANLIENFREHLHVLAEQMDVIFMNKEEAKAFAKGPELAIEQLKKNASYVVVKLGKEGCMIYEKKSDKIITVQGTPVKAIDTTGAGDSFAAGFLYGLNQGFSAKHAGIIGNAVGAQVVQHLGTVLDDNDLQIIHKVINDCRLELKKGGYYGL